MCHISIFTKLYSIRDLEFFKNVRLLHFNLDLFVAKEAKRRNLSSYFAMHFAIQSLYA